MKLIDLSRVLNEQTPVYPGDPYTKIEPAGILDNDGYCDHLVSLGTHVGTHMDAPAHMLAGGKTLDQFPVERFIGRGAYIKTGKEFDLEKIKSSDIKKGDIVILHTGMEDQYDKSEYFENYPSIPEEVAQYFVEKEVSVVGMDMCSPDHPPFNTHKVLLRNDVLIIENLTNLSSLEGKNFEIYALPVKLQLDAAAVRVVARLE